MNIHQLSRERINHLKYMYYRRNINPYPSYEEILSVEDLVSDELIFQLYSNVVFPRERYFENSTSGRVFNENEYDYD